MAWRFRKSLSIGGLRFNFGKSGFTSISAGGRGFTANISGTGVRRTISVPGTGLSFQTKASSQAASALPMRRQGANMGFLSFVLLWVVASLVGSSISPLVGSVVMLGLPLAFLVSRVRKNTRHQAEVEAAEAAAKSHKAAQDKAVAALIAFWSAMKEATTLEEVDVAVGVFQAIAAEVDLVQRERDEQADLADRVREVIRARAEWSTGTIPPRRGTIQGDAYYWQSRDVERRDYERGVLYLTAKGLLFETPEKCIVRKWRDVAGVTLNDSTGSGGFVALTLRNRLNKESFSFRSNQEARLVAELVSQLTTQ